MDLLARVVVWLNTLANALGRVLLAPVSALPGWLSATLSATVAGVLLLVVFKYTSNQRAIRRVRNEINAQLLALKLFKDNAAVAVDAQGRILQGAGRLQVLAIVPMLVMLVPVCLLLAQLALWYQARPLHTGEETVVTMKLNGTEGSPWPEVRLEPADAGKVTLGPVRVHSKREICWDWYEALKNPWEAPFRPDSPVRSIEIDYPGRASWTSGTNWWVVYWFAVSMLAGFCCRRWVNVHI
jgi:hypothetical protein